MTQKLHLNVNALNAGIFGGSWRHPEHDPLASYTLEHYTRIARIAEDAKLDAIFLADGPVVAEDARYRPSNSLEPSTVVAAVARETTHLGLIGTFSSTYNDPYELARRLLSLDIVSGGRVGWNVVTTAGPRAAQNFGFDAEPDHGGRYERAAHVVETAQRLWRGGSVVDTDGRERSLDLDRSRQGEPVIVQAGGSSDGIRLAGRVAEAIFSAAQTLDEALAFARSVRAAAQEHGRSASSITLLPGVSTVIGSTEREARARRDELAALVPEPYALARLSAQLGFPLDDLDLDAPIPRERLVPVSEAGGSQTFNAAVRGVIERDSPTLRELLRHLGGGGGHRIVVGTPEQIADDLERWFRAGAADGFNVMPDVLPSGFEVFATEVVPILQRRGLFRRDYATSTLRGHFTGTDLTADAGSPRCGALASLRSEAVEARAAGSAELVLDDTGSGLDPTIAAPFLSPLAPATRLVVEADTATNPPYNLARRILSLHRATSGGVELRLRSTGIDEVSRRALESHGAGSPDPALPDVLDDYAAAVTDLWSSFREEALIGDQAAGLLADVSLIRPVDHVGPVYRVRGPLNVPAPSSAAGLPTLVRVGTTDLTETRVKTSL